MKTFKLFCRVCAKLKCQDKKSQNLFGKQKYDVMGAIQEVTGVPLKNEKFLPQHICQKCLKDLRQAREFRKCFILAQEYFTTPEYKNALKLTDAQKAQRYSSRKRNDVKFKTESSDDMQAEFGMNERVEQHKYDLKSKPIDTLSLKEEPITAAESEIFEEEIHLNANGEHETTSHNCEAMEFHTLKLEKDELEFAEEDLNNSTEFTADQISHQDELEREKNDIEKVLVKKSMKNKPKSNRRVALSKRQQADSKTKPSRKEKIINKKQTNYICDQCGFYFTNRNHFRSHMIRHSGKKTHQCEICVAKFYTSSELNRHMRHHTGERPFACRHCERSFSDYSTRLKHERTHTNERPYSCTQCDKAFTRPYILKNHMLVHTGERHFHCSVCDKSFPRQTNLVVHFNSKFHKQNDEKQQNAKQQKDFANYVLETIPT